MSDQSILIGRDDVVDAVRECVSWDEHRRLPIVVLIGPTGSGKTTILRTLREMTANLHVARIDVAGQRFRTAAQVMTALVLQLGYKRRGIRRLVFSRFLIGRLATQVELRGRSPSADEAAMRAFTDSLRGRRLPPDVRRLAGKVGELVGPWIGLPALPGAAELALEAVDAALFAIRRPDGLGWWGTGPLDRISALVELHRKVNQGSADERQAAELELARAFLADLHESYQGTVLSSPTRTASVVLLDDAHTTAGQLTLGLLARARMGDPAGPDPLLMVAACDRRPAGLDIDGDPHDVPADVARWREGVRRERPGTWFLPVTVAPFTPAETQEWGHRLGRHDRAVLAAAHRVTEGHPAGLAELLPADPFGHFRAVLTGTALTGTALARPAELAAALLPGLDDRMVADLTVCAAARRMTLAQARVALDQSRDGRAVTLRAELTARWWLRPDDTLHPWLRQLLLLALQAQPAAWTAVHQRLHAHHEAAGDRVGAAYHRLAAGDHEPVVEMLRGDLDRGGPEWFTAIREITRAPRRPGGRPVRTPAGTDRVGVSLTRLVLGLAQVADPLHPAPDDAVDLVGRACQELAGLRPESADGFYTLAAEHTGKVDT